MRGPGNRAGLLFAARAGRAHGQVPAWTAAAFGQPRIRPNAKSFFERGILDAYVHDKVEANDALLERVQRLTPIAGDAGLTMPQMALAWRLRQKNVASVIIGASRPDQVNTNVSASGVVLTADLLARNDAVLA